MVRAVGSVSVTLIGSDPADDLSEQTRRANIFGDVPDYDPEAHHRAGEKADELGRQRDWTDCRGYFAYYAPRLSAVRHANKAA
jgi:hypothetical protein